MRGENCVDARVRVIRRIANTIDTTVIIEVATLLRIVCATPGSSREGKRVCGIQALISGVDSSSDESTAPTTPKTTAIANGRIRKPPRSAYIAERNITVGAQAFRSPRRLTGLGSHPIERNSSTGAYKGLSAPRKWSGRAILPDGVLLRIGTGELARARPLIEGWLENATSEATTPGATKGRLPRCGSSS
jgi:hypothetical protein